MAIGRTAAALSVVLLLVVLVGLVLGLTAASRFTDPPGVQAMARSPESAARDFWDNPLQRIAYLSVAITEVRGNAACPVYVVSAFTLFGIVANRAEVDCNISYVHGVP